MLEAIVSFCLLKIADFLINDISSLINVHRNVRQMENELRLLAAFLKDAESKEEHDERVRSCISMIKDVVYEAEDFIDTFLLEKEFNRRWNVVLLHKFNAGVEKICERIPDLREQLVDYGVISSVVESSQPRRLQLLPSYSHVPELDVVGLTDDTNKLVEILKSDCPVVSICGMGGLGKTTLAKQVYHHLLVEQHFTVQVWVYVSEECKTREIWETVLFKLISPDRKKREEIAKMKDHEVAELVYNEQKLKNCLVVLDDMWKTADWRSLSPGFPLQESDSKILLTTRSKEVADSLRPRGFIHEPQCLNDVEAWQLFLMKIPNDLTIDARREIQATEMVKQCKGLPLGIVVLGGLLQSVSDWDEVHENLKAHLNKRTADRGEPIFDVLAVSYDYLPRQLKTCFLYLGIFPYDHDISVERVINLWVAEGIISSSDLAEGEVLEDCAYFYLQELVQRYMVQVEYRDPIGRIEACHMHDLMRDVCLTKARRKDMYRIINFTAGNNSFQEQTTTASGQSIRRIALHLNNFNGNVERAYPSYRSIICFSLDGFSGISQELFETMVKEFKLLRVLDLEGVKGFAISINIKSLIHLRLLNVNSAWIGKLPDIGNFTYLLTLYLDRYDSADIIPDVIWKLKRLRHLYLPRSCGRNTKRHMCLPSCRGRNTKRLQLANLGDLQTLVNFPAAPIADVYDLITLRSLRKLVIRIEDETSLRTFNGIFYGNEEAPILFPYLRSLAINGTITQPDVNQIKSRCPRLGLVMTNGWKVYPE